MASPNDEGLTRELEQLEKLVAALRSRIGTGKPVPIVVDQAIPSYTSYVEAVIEGRARIADYLPSNYFGDPAFDMLLDLFVSVERGQARTVKVCALTSRVPIATASRYIDMMARDGFVRRKPDPADGRRTLVVLTPSAKAAMDDWLSTISSIPLRRG